MHKDEFLYDLPAEVKHHLSRKFPSFTRNKGDLTLRFIFPYLPYARVKLAYRDDQTILKSVEADTEKVRKFKQIIAAETLAVAEVSYNIENEIEAGKISYDFCKEMAEEVDYLRNELSTKKEEWDARLTKLFDRFERDYASTTAATYRSAIFHIVKNLPLCLVCRHITDPQTFESLDADRRGACKAAMNIYMKME